MYAETAKSRHAIRLLEKTGVLDEIEQIVWGCASDAFGEDCYKYDFETYAKSGTYYFLHHRFPIGARHGGMFIEEEAAVCVRHFEHGVMAKVHYEFGRHDSLRLKFLLRDSYVHGEFGEFSLFAVLRFQDYIDYYRYDVDAFTQPFFDPEDSVSKTLLWLDLQS